MRKLTFLIFLILPIIIFSQEIKFLDKPFVIENFNNIELPYYIETSDTIPLNSNWDFYLNVDSTYFITSEQLNKYSSNLTNNFDIHYAEQIVNGKKQIVFFICPFRKVSDNKIEVLRNWNIQVIFSPTQSNNISHKRTYASNSVLSNGHWIKLSTKQKGFHLITYENLVSWGLISSPILSDKLRVYCNGSRMLPEANSVPRYDDLHEISIDIRDGGDGTLDPGDYAIFYAEAPVYWDFDHTTKTFVHSRNLYSEKNYVFVTINDVGMPQRISTAISPTGNIDLSVNTFMDYNLSENELYNFNKSGKQWIGDKFDYNLSNDYSFYFPNIVADSNVYIKAIVYGKSELPSSFRLIYGSNSYTIPIQPVSGYLDEYAKVGTANVSYKSSNPTINITLKYQQGGSNNAVGWLDYLEVIAWRYLSFYGSQLSFSHPLLPSNKIAKYTIANAPNDIYLYDVSVPEHPIRIIGTHSSSNYQFVDSTNKIKNYIAVASTFIIPSYEGTVSNQNLHALSQVDYIIIAPNRFYQMAKRLGDLHLAQEGLSYVIVSPDIIYNEFSSGKQDIAAIRDFIKMFYDRATNDDEKPKYVLLFGDASYDYLNRINNNTNIIPTFESIASVSPTASYASDDFYALLDDGEGYECNGALDIGVGRLPVINESQAWAMVNKIENYYKKHGRNDSIIICNESECLVPQLSDWRNKIVLVADDEDGNLYVNQAEDIASLVENIAPQINIEKIYLDAYPQISTPAGQRAPNVNAAINKTFTDGILLFNYIGHGGEEGLAHERILQIADIQSWQNKCAMPLMITATCEFSRYDDPGRPSAGEYVILNPNGGAITMMTTSRIAYSSYNAMLNNALMDTLMRLSRTSTPCFGDVFVIAKNAANNANALKNFILLGDPASKIAFPANNIIIDSINNKSINHLDTLSAYEFITITGHLENFNGNLLNDFDGTIYITMYDKKQEFSTLGTDQNSSPVPFKVFSNIVYKGSASVHNGLFTIQFYMPIDIQYNIDKGRITLYAENGKTDASGYTNNFLIGGSSTPITDNQGPQINLYLNSTNFHNGDVVNENPTLLSYINDEHGINITGQAIGHDLVAWIDNDYTNPLILNSFFRYSLDSYKDGYLIYPLSDLSAGEHYITVRAWDVFNNSSEASINFQVIPNDNLTINKIFAYPNPMISNTTFYIQHNQACCNNKIIIEIYDILGNIIAVLENESYNDAYYNTEIQWDGTTINGGTIAPGTYIFKGWLENEVGKTSIASGKILVISDN
jgi:hypothetical protein